ncbi:MAG TPA: VOC family protein [Puia sp.]
MDNKDQGGSPDFLPRLTGSFAIPAAENPTVAMVEAAYRHHGLHWRYINCEVSPEGLGAAVRGARAMGWAGFNCSIPHKVAVIEHLDGLGESATIIGAVNTIVRRDDTLIGENTDGKGFVQAMRTVTDPAGKRVVLFGAGGAARAVSVEMALAGASHITIVNRDTRRGQAVAGLLNERTGAKAEFIPWNGTFVIPGNTDIVINATSIGLYPDIEARLDIDFDSLHPAMVVADGIPNPPRTHLIRTAEARGCRVLDGLQMLVNQGVIGIKYWTGVDVDPGVMHEVLRGLFTEKGAPAREGKGKEEIGIRRLDHVLISIPVGRQEEARRFYADVLGLEEIEGEHPRGAMWFTMGTIQLHIRGEAGSWQSDRHLAFEVANLENARQYLGSKGVGLSYSSAIDGRKRFFFRDPFGNRIELLQYEY